MKSVFRLLPFLFLLGLSAYLPGVRAETCRANIGQTTVNIPKEGANKQVISSQADSLIKISRIWADFFPANTSNQPI